MHFQAAFKIDVLIVGGGISGLACAYALGRSGHNVRVFEKTNGHQRGAGVRVPPNLTKILIEWGLEKELKKCQTCRKTTFMSLDGGEVLGILEWKEDVLREAGGQFLLIRYDDLYQMLYRLALSVGALITFNSTVTGADATATPTTAGRSAMRKIVTEMDDIATDSGHTWYTVIVPIERMVSDPELVKWAHTPQWPIWMGDNRCAFGFPIGNNYSFSIYWPDTDVSLDAFEGWNVYCPTSILDLSPYDDRVRRLFTMMPTAQRVKYVLRDRVEEWVDHSGRMLLVGEAAHPLLPHSTHGASMAIEDAEALGVLMSHLGCREQIPQLTEGFQELRRARCDFIHHGELSNAMLTTMLPGEMRDMRDAGMRESLTTGVERWDDDDADEALREQWEQIEVGFAYHAREASEDWWMKWGTLSNGDAAKSGLAIEIATSSIAVDHSND
ncbi:3-hydroxybenzoate 6-hydroxylase 1 [Mycena sanguinolenta]|uniref:3-hydroxybenzoate 6-hydroxylase 1 n=1 Tax=Mycena sanguinolenta TaxID=230812 RepID=A0A8H6Y9H7_9AGAR|nr:3-hydroxybenzoate 6-hydroxylase 1 [Mycena sanguinolenta]